MFKNQNNTCIKAQINRVCKFTLLLITVFFFSNHITAQSKVFDVESFDKIVVSPSIEVLFKQGAKESVTIESITVPIEKLNIVVENKVLNVYLEGAKITANKKWKNENNHWVNDSKYKGTVVKVVVTYKTINSLDLRGNERFTFENTINTEKLNLRIYGKSQVYMNSIEIQNLQISIFGESYLEIKQGSVENQKITAYGASRTNTLDVKSKETKITAYGNGVFQLNASEKLKITSYGEATINYSGGAQVQKGLIIGETKITNVNF